MSIALRFLPPLLAIALMGQTPEPGFTSLWNGKDFTDWKVANPATFTIKDGAMVANGSQGHAFYDGPFRNHTFRNFELKVDVMTKPGSNGGVFILTEFQEKGWPSKGFEIQVNNTFKNDPVRTGSLYHVMDTKEAPAKDDEWFTEHIIVNGDTITVRVNDKQIIEWKATPEIRPRSGRRSPARSRCRPMTPAARCSTGTSASSRWTDTPAENPPAAGRATGWPAFRIFIDNEAAKTREEARTQAFRARPSAASRQFDAPRRSDDVLCAAWG